MNYSGYGNFSYRLFIRHYHKLLRTAADFGQTRRKHWRNMLAVDIGNTFTRVAAFEGGVIRARQTFRTDVLDVAELAAAFAILGGKAASPEVWTSSVAPSANAVVDAAADRAGLRRRFIRSATDPIIPHRLSTPQTTGVDRLLSAMAAGTLYFPEGTAPDGYVVVQCGSAATVDLVDGTGTFCGGYILPGPRLWLSGISRAAQLPDFSTESPDWNAVAPGDNTHDAILHGMAAALPLAVASAVGRIGAPEGAEASPSPLPVAITGGWAEAAARFLDGPCRHDKDLLLHGIRLFAEKVS